MDDGLFSVDTEDQAVHLINTLKKLLRKGGFEFVKIRFSCLEFCRPWVKRSSAHLVIVAYNGWVQPTS